MVFLTAVLASAMLAIVVSPGGHGPSTVTEQMDCGTIVRQVVRETGGRLLSVRSHGGQCVINILIQRDNERPRKIIIRADPRKQRMAGGGVVLWVDRRNEAC